MDQISPLPALTQDEVRVGAWAEVHEPLELQLSPLGRRALAALAPRPGESVLDIGCGGGWTAPELARPAAPARPVAGAHPSVPAFAFANRDSVRRILERAGFGEIEITARDEQVGSGDLDTMLFVCSRVGALGKILRENPELRAATLPVVRSALAAHDGPDGVRLNAATWVVTARAPAGL